MLSGIVIGVYGFVDIPKSVNFFLSYLEKLSLPCKDISVNIKLLSTVQKLAEAKLINLEFLLTERSRLMDKLSHDLEVTKRFLDTK